MKKLDEVEQNHNPWQKRQYFHNGIVFRGILYSSRELMDIRRETSESVPVEVSPDLSNARAIFVRFPNKKEPIRVPPVTPLIPPKN